MHPIRGNEIKAIKVVSGKLLEPHTLRGRSGFLCRCFHGLDAFRHGPVKDNISANREAPQAFGRLIPQASHTGAYGQGLELFSEGIENASARASLSSAM